MDFKQKVVEVVICPVHKDEDLVCGQASRLTEDWFRKKVSELEAECKLGKRLYADRLKEIDDLHGKIDMVIDYLNHPDSWEYKEKVKPIIIEHLKELSVTA